MRFGKVSGVSLLFVSLLNGVAFVHVDRLLISCPLRQFSNLIIICWLFSRDLQIVKFWADTDV